jgi:hypothetical protein
MVVADWNANKQFGNENGGDNHGSGRFITCPLCLNIAQKGGLQTRHYHYRTILLNSKTYAMQANHSPCSAKILR